MNQWACGSEYPGHGRAKADGGRGSDASGQHACCTWYRDQMISVVRTIAASDRWGAVEGQESWDTWRCRESQRPPARVDLLGSLPLFWGCPGEKGDTCPRDGALEVNGLLMTKDGIGEVGRG